MALLLQLHQLYCIPGMHPQCMYPWNIPSRHVPLACTPLDMYPPTRTLDTYLLIWLAGSKPKQGELAAAVGSCTHEPIWGELAVKDTRNAPLLILSVGGRLAYLTIGMLAYTATPTVSHVSSPGSPHEYCEWKQSDLDHKTCPPSLSGNATAEI